MKRQIWLALVAMVWTADVKAITVDGTLDAGYGAAVSVQAVQTDFGDAVPPTTLGGSELDAAYVRIEGGRLYLMLTGNHEPNFNKLEIYFDSVAGGENVLSATPQYDYSGDGGTTWNSQNQGGMTFDTGFEADYHLFSRWGGGAGTQPYEADFINRQGGASAMVPGSAAATDPPVDLVASGFVPAGDLGPNASGTALTQNLEFAINNSNAAGVSGCGGGSGCAAADQLAAAAVTTGMEFSVALADIGNPTPGSTIRISALISNSDHHYLSNQALGSFAPPQSNLGGTGHNVGDAFNDGSFTGSLGTGPVTGDYNLDNKVDAADYTVWRDNLESSITLPNDATPGFVDNTDYTEWKTNFGLTGGINLNRFAGDQFFSIAVPGEAGLSAGGGVPEPTSAFMLLVGLVIGSATLRRRG